jgi:hypothetical protein
VPNGDYFVSVGLQRTNRKTGQTEKLVTLLLYTSEKCSRKLHEGLKRRNQSTTGQLAYRDFYQQLLKLRYSNKSRLNPTDKKIILETRN